MCDNNVVFCPEDVEQVSANTGEVVYCLHCRKRDFLSSANDLAGLPSAMLLVNESKSAALAHMSRQRDCRPSNHPAVFYCQRVLTPDELKGFSALLTEKFGQDLLEFDVVFDSRLN